MLALNDAGVALQCAWVEAVVAFAAQVGNPRSETIFLWLLRQLCCRVEGFWQNTTIYSSYIIHLLEQGDIVQRCKTWNNAQRIFLF